MDQSRLEQIHRWCSDPESVDEIGYDYARELLDEVERLRANDCARTDFENAPSPCLGWCVFPLGGAWRMIWRSVPGKQSGWSSHGNIQDVRYWRPLPRTPEQKAQDVDAAASQGGK